MDAFASIADLATAAAGLSVVQDVIGAIRAADAAEATTAPNGPVAAASTCPAAIYEPSDCCIHREPCYAPRQIIHPEPRYADRRIIHPEPRIGATRPALEPWPHCEETHGPISASPIQPPWAVLPWGESPKPAIRVKVIVHRTDIVSKGMLLDTFV